MATSGTESDIRYTEYRNKGVKVTFRNPSAGDWMEMKFEFNGSSIRVNAKLLLKYDDKIGEALSAVGSLYFRTEDGFTNSAKTDFAYRVDLMPELLPAPLGKIARLQTFELVRKAIFNKEVQARPEIADSLMKVRKEVYGAIVKHCFVPE